MSTDSPPSLRWWMDERRGELGLTWQQVAERAGVSTETLYRAAEGRQMRTTTRKGIERALEWEPGGVDAVLTGQTPQPLKAPVSARSVETIDDLPDTERQRFLMARDFMRTQGRELTVRMWMVMRDEYLRLAELDRSSNPDHAL